VKVGDLVRFRDDWREILKAEEERFLARGFVRTKPNAYDIDRLAIVVQDWDTHDNFAVLFLGEAEIVDFNEHVSFSDEIMEVVSESR